MRELLNEHLHYLKDEARLNLFTAAVAKVVRHDTTVLDLGCGTGILGMLCLRAGAKRVYFVDTTNLTQVARRFADVAGLGDRAMAIRGHSMDITVPNPVDVVISDLVGHFGFEAGVVEAFDDARHRLLKPGGTLIPRRIRLHLAAVESSSSYQAIADWDSLAIARELRWLRHNAVNVKHPIQLSTNELLTEPHQLGAIDLRVPTPSVFKWSTELRVEREGTLHGLGGWFDCELADGVSMTNSPLAKGKLQRPQAFLPIEQPVTVARNDVLRATVTARPADDLIAWIVEVIATGQVFKHSTFHGTLMTKDDLSRLHPQHIPHLNRSGRARLAVLSRCDGVHTAQEIEDAVIRDQHESFGTAERCSQFIARVLGSDTD